MDAHRDALAEVGVFVGDRRGLDVARERSARDANRREAAPRNVFDGGQERRREWIDLLGPIDASTVAIGPKDLAALAIDHQEEPIRASYRFECGELARDPLVFDVKVRR